MLEYYKDCAYPKPQNKKKKKKRNGWKNKSERCCAYCGKPYAERHEVFGGSNRQISIDLGFQIDVCHEHHEELHMNCSEWAEEENQKLRSFYQKKYEEEKKINEGLSAYQARRAWMLLIGRNYL